MKAIGLLVLALVFSRVDAAAQQGRESAEVDRFVQRQMDSLSITGMAVGVVKDGQIVHLKGYGFASLEWKQPVTEHTNFQVASCSKLLSSTVVLRSLAEGRLRLSDPVARYLDSLPASWSGIQVQHLLNHSSGIPFFNGDPYLDGMAVLRALRDSALQFSPGARQSYMSGDGIVLRLVLEKAWGRPYDQLLKDLVTIPAGMTDGGFDHERRSGSWMRADVLPGKATTYYRNGNIAYKFIYPEYMYTAGGYFASLRDMARWAVALDKELFFSRKQEAFAYQCGSASDSACFSNVGWGVEREGGLTFAGHSGGPGLADILRFPSKGYTIIVLSNDGELLPGMARAVAGFYIKELDPKLSAAKFKRP
ncbi:class A beta-lactamase-related serine hydrolase [Flaviaesturariibacter flavus]|uniref:Class A beta-lactamase-related serine hydrolase n=1 Tax=Flaviaesturariibacter flavus TaxID=2502780 RepID=A0A4R1BA11_9BACT|nr:serine hydrolase domain-containing protein [Flaviaesturariibacter flavus]TCJ13738.1 class A beta-lactamase-related serine hydrolase [Flaviaesturariibacter flavus]